MLAIIIAAAQVVFIVIRVVVSWVQRFHTISSFITVHISYIQYTSQFTLKLHVPDNLDLVAKVKLSTVIVASFNYF